jgi:hypothetical protein
MIIYERGEKSDLAYLKVLPQYGERSLSTQVSKAACGKYIKPIKITKSGHLHCIERAKWRNCSNELEGVMGNT